MTNDRNAVGQELAAQIWGIEDSIDESILRVGEMISQLPAARKRCRLSATVGQDVFVGAAATFDQLVKARGEAINLHAQLATLAEQTGVSIRMMGSDWKLQPGIPKLASVSSEAA